MTEGSPLPQPPVIVTERLHLRRLVPEDLRPVANVLTDPALAPALPLGRTFEALAECRRWLEETIAGYAHPSPHFRAAIVPTSDIRGRTLSTKGRLLGLALIAPHDRWEKGLRVGVALLAEGRGHGYGREAARATTSHAFAEGGARWADAVLSLEEGGAIAIAAHLGFANDGAADHPGPTMRRFRAHHPPGGRPPRRRR